MPVLTQEALGSSLIASAITMVVLVIFQVYMLYLNWKQSKVKDKTETMIELLIEIRDLLKKKK